MNGNKNPWSLPHITKWAGPNAAVCSAEDRLREVRKMDLATLRAVDGWRDNQRTVQRAIEVRMRKLIREMNRRQGVAI